MTEPRRITPARRAQLLRQPGWYVEPDMADMFHRPCMTCRRTLQAGDVVRMVPGLRLVDMQKLGACCAPTGKPVLKIEESASGGYFG